MWNFPLAHYFYYCFNLIIFFSSPGEIGKRDSFRNYFFGLRVRVPRRANKQWSIHHFPSFLFFLIFKIKKQKWLYLRNRNKKRIFKKYRDFLFWKKITKFLKIRFSKKKNEIYLSWNSSKKIWNLFGLKNNLINLT